MTGLQLFAFTLAEYSFFDTWETARKATAHGPDAAMLATIRWMTRRALAAERSNPQLRVFKDAVNAATREVDAASDGPEDILKAKLAAQDRAIQALIKEIERWRPL